MGFTLIFTIKKLKTFFAECGLMNKKYSWTNAKPIISLIGFFVPSIMALHIFIIKGEKKKVV